MAENAIVGDRAYRVAGAVDGHQIQQTCIFTHVREQGGAQVAEVLVHIREVQADGDVVGLRARLELLHDPQVVDDLVQVDADADCGAIHDQTRAVLVHRVEVVVGRRDVAKAHVGGRGKRGEGTRAQLVQPGRARGEVVRKVVLALRFRGSVTKAVLQPPVAGQGEIHAAGELRQFHVRAAFHVDDLRAGGRLHRDLLGFAADDGAEVRIKPRHAVGITVAVERQRNRQVEDHVVVEVLHVEVEPAAVRQIATEGEARLETVVRPETRITHAVADAPETADTVLPVARRTAVPRIDAVVTKIADLVLDRTFSGVAAAACHKIDNTTRSVGCEDRRGTAAHDLEPLDRFIEPKRLVGIEPAEPAVVLDRQAVFLQGHRGETVGRNAAGADVVTRFTAGGFNPEAGHSLQGLRHPDRRLHAQLFRGDIGQCVAGFRLGAELRARATGDHKFAEPMHLVGIVDGGPRAGPGTALGWWAGRTWVVGAPDGERSIGGIFGRDQWSAGEHAIECFAGRELSANRVGPNSAHVFDEVDDLGAGLFGEGFERLRGVARIDGEITGRRVGRERSGGSGG